MAPTSTSSIPARSAWLRGPAWDTGLLAFCWVPFYLWVVGGLGLGAEAFGADALGRRDTRAAIALATIVALGCSYVHRHYTLLLVYGDAETFARRRRAFVVAPLLVITALVLARTGYDLEWLRIGKLRVTPWLAILTLSGAWNVWHTVQQRYGILRAYAAKTRAGLETRAHAHRDRALLWASIAAVAVVLLTWRVETFAAHGNARRTLRTLEPFVEHAAWPGVTALLLGIFALCLALWLRYELAADLTWHQRLPRWTFLGSTFALLAVFAVHGPILGYLCFGTAHAIEYLAFVHHFSQARRRDQSRASLAMRLLGGSWWTSLGLVGALGVAYVVLREVDDLSVYLVYYFGASLLHFLYDGWIWKVRAPEVRRPLGIETSA